MEADVWTVFLSISKSTMTNRSVFFTIYPKLRSLRHSCIFPTQSPTCTLCLQYLGSYCANGISRDDLPDEFLVIFLSVWIIFTQRKECCSIKVACNLIQELEEMKKWLHVEDVAHLQCLSDRPGSLRLILRILLTVCDSSYLWSYHLEGEEMKISCHGG